MTDQDVSEAVRHSQLLQPIRDLADNWNIDVARELEDYLQEIESLRFAFEGTSDTFNFAEAALMIQGSACIYSKKVEYLYRLVYETLDLLASRKAKNRQVSSINAKGEDADAAELLAKQMEEFLELDDIKEAANIDLAENGRAPSKLASVDRIPLSLMALEEPAQAGDPTITTAKGDVIGNRSDFCMNTSIVHDSGALLLGEDDVRFIDHTFHNPGALSAAATAAPSAVVQNPPQFFDAQLDMDYDDGPADLGDMDAPATSEQAAAAHSRAAVAEPAIKLGGGGRAKQTSFANNDPWKPLDPHDAESVSEYRAPFKRLTTYRVPVQLVRQRRAEEKGEKSSSKKAVAEVEPLATFFDKMEKTARSRRSRLAVDTMSAFVELQLEEDARRAHWAKEDRRAARQAQAADVNVDLAGPHAPATAANAAVEDQLSRIVMGDFDGDLDVGGGDFADEAYNGPADLGDDFQGLGFYQDDQPLANAPVPSYEELVQQYINKFVAEADRYKRETDLSRRIKEWEDRIQPRLEAEEKRKPFDIYVYGDNILEKLPKDTKRKDKPQPLAALVDAPTAYEVCRTFLATLQLANSGNVDIVQPAGAATDEGDVQIKLLSMRKHRDDLQAFRAPSLQVA